MRRGIVLLTTLLLVVMVLMVVGAAVLLLPRGMATSADTRTQNLALQAAQAGVTYAQARLQQSVPPGGGGWAGDGNAQVVDLPDHSLSVVEDHGNVIGVLRTPEGQVSEFLVRFNPQDGSQDPQPQHQIANPYISVNNLFIQSVVPVPLGNGANFAQTNASNYDCPPQTVILLVEGRAGEGLAGATCDNPYPDPGNRRVSSLLVECHLSPNSNGAMAGAIFAGNGLDGQVTKDGLQMGVVVKGDTPSLVVNGDAKMSDGTNPSVIVTAKNAPQGELHMPTSSTYTGSLSHTARLDGVPSFPALDWSQVKQGTAANLLKAGIYMWRDPGGGKQLYYYDQSYENYLAGSWAPPAPSPGDLVSTLGGALGTAVSNGAMATGKNAELDFSKDIKVVASSSSNSLAVVSEGPTTPAPFNFGPQDSSGQTFKFAPPSNGNSNMVYLSNPDGNIYLQGKLDGSKGASIVSGGNIVMSGGGSDVNGYGIPREVPVNLYAKNGISLNSEFYNGGKSGYGDLKLRGMVYSWGDVSLVASDGVSKGGKVTLTGALVAYGCDTDPSKALAGSAMLNGKGMVKIEGYQTDIKYDSSVLEGLKAGMSVLKLRRVFWAVY